MAQAPDPIEVMPPTFGADMAGGCAMLLASGRHADVTFELPARTLRAHRAIIEARCGSAMVQALEAGRLWSAASDEGLLRITLTTQAVGDASGASLSALLTCVGAFCAALL